MKYIIIILLSFISIHFNSFSQDINPEFRTEDKIKLNEAFILSEKFGSKIWRRWADVTFPVLLITDSTEYLIGHSRPSFDFENTGYDPLLNTEVFSRKRVFQKNLLATFPAVNNISTVVVGLPENTGKTSISWIITILHEHFHQYQYSDTEYNKSVNELELSGGDSTGMWMLNFPFPYENPEISSQYQQLNIAAYNAAFSNDAEFKNYFDIYLTERNRFKNLLSEKDYRYFSFQIWQEGLAKYTELKFLELMTNENYETKNPDLKLLRDYFTYSEQYQKLLGNIKENSGRLELGKSKRVCFYYLGALEGIILERNNPDWRERYLVEKFYIENYFK